MTVSNARLLQSIFALSFVVFGILIGGLLHNPADPPSYAQGSIYFMQFKNIYNHSGVVYPPFLYAVAAVFLSILSNFIDIYPTSYTAISTFVGIGAVTQVVCYLLGRNIISAKRSWNWFIASLFNPFVVYVTLVFGQMEVFVILGLVGVIYAELKEEWAIGGAALAIAASVKIYPVVLFFPYIYHNKEKAYNIILGAAPVGAFTAILMMIYLPESLTIVRSASGGVRPVNALYILTLSYIPSWTATLVFLTTFSIAIAISLFVDDISRYIIPLIPLVLFYPDILEYRWLPITVGTILIGYLPGNINTNIEDICESYGSLWLILGTLAMAVGTIEGWYEGKPWIVPTTGVLPEPVILFGTWQLNTTFGPFFNGPILVELFALRMIRTGIAILFIASIISWALKMYEETY